MLPVPFPTAHHRPVAFKNAEACNRARKAARLARVVETRVDDARVLTDEQWAEATIIAGVVTPSAATRAGVVALVDVAQGRTSERATGSADEQIAYNSLRKAGRIAEVFAEVGLDAEDATAEQWDLARQIIEAKEVSVVIRDTAKVLGFEWRPAHDSTSHRRDAR